MPGNANKSSKTKISRWDRASRMQGLRGKSLIEQVRLHCPSCNASFNCDEKYKAHYKATHLEGVNQGETL